MSNQENKQQTIDTYLENCLKKYNARLNQVNLLEQKILTLQSKVKQLKELNEKLAKNIQNYGKTQKIERDLERRNEAARKAKIVFDKFYNAKDYSR